MFLLHFDFLVARVIFKEALRCTSVICNLFETKVENHISRVTDAV